MEENNTKTDHPLRSTQTQELAAALAKAQAEMPICGKNDEVSYGQGKARYKYANYADMVRVSRPALTKHGLSVRHEDVFTDGQYLLYTILTHEASGQFTSCCAPINTSLTDRKQIGSDMTYIKRYSYGNIIGLAVDDATDDDASAASIATSQKKTVKPSDNGMITREQYDILKLEIGDNTEFEEKVCAYYKIRMLKHLPKTAFSTVLEKIREINAALKTVKDG